MIQGGKINWRGKEFTAWLENHAKPRVQQAADLVVEEARRLILAPKSGRHRRYKGRSVRSSAPGEALGSPSGRLPKSIQSEVGRIPKGFGARVGIGPPMRSAWAEGMRDMMLGKRQGMKGQRPTLRPALERVWPKIVKLLSHIPKAQ